jgi:predicted DNA-binding transcriptional regulator YafY
VLVLQHGEKSQSRAERLNRIERILYDAPSHGLAPREIAERCGVHRTTVWRDIRALENNGVPIWNDGGRYLILRERYITSVRLNLYEATVLFLAARLLARYADKSYPHIARAMEKLAAAMPKDMMQRHIQRMAGLVRERRDWPEFTRMMERLTEAWAERRRVRLWQRADGNRAARARLFEPYFLDPSSVGYALYVIGYDHLRQGIRTFKVERLQRVEVTDERFEIPDGFDPYEYLHKAWGINWGDGSNLHQVRLRFPPGRITERVKESEWHVSQEIEDLPDGGCVLSVRVGATLEMKPWILQWGPHCEVLSPPELRAEIAEEMRRAAEVYMED